MNWLSKSLALMAVAAIVATAVTISTPPAHAQVDDSLPPLADLSIVSTDEFGRGVYWTVDVKNNTVGHHPGTTVRTVKVKIPLSLGITSLRYPEDVEAIGYVTTWTYDDGTGVLTITNLRPGETARFGADAPDIPAGGQGLIALRFYAEIIETHPAEPPGFQFNNATEHWLMGDRGSGTTRFTSGDTAVAVQVSDPIPEVGGKTTFTVHAANLDHLTHADNDVQIDSSQLDVQIQISLSPGLNFSGTQQAPAGTTFRSGAGIWEVGTLGWRDGDDRQVFPLAVSLTSESLEDLPLEGRCLTAKVVRAVPWFAFDHSKRENDTATVCLGKPPKVLLSQGDANLFHYFDCVGVTTPPCTDADTLELVAEPPVGPFGDTAYLQPDAVIVHISDPAGRYAGNWRTGTALRHSAAAPRVDGVGVAFQFVPTGWSAYTWAISDVSPKQRPGTLSILHRLSGDRTLLDADTQTSLGPFNLSSSVTSQPYPAFVTFGALGTYKINLTVGATKSGSEYTATGAYTFHVGPVTEMEVRDAGANPAVAPGKRAYTVMALNNGPDTAQGVRVTLSKVPEEAEATLSHGIYTPGTCQNGLCEGAWTIGDLIPGDYRASGHANESPTLTLVTADGDPITATIESTQDYSVVIDGTTHTTNYYDYVENNNTATIAARRGTAPSAGAPGAPSSLRVDKFGSLALLRWQPVERVNGLEVTHYQVERNGINVADDVGGTMYVDLRGSAVNQSYRVRAVNIFGVPGPWSWSAGASGPLEPRTDELDPPNGLTATPGLGDARRIDLSWFAPSADTGLRYVIEHATDGAGPWTTLAHGYNSTTYSHTGGILLPGTTHYYRVAAVRGNDISAWAYVQATTEIVDGVAYYAPGWPENLRFTSVARTSVTLAWDPPVDDGGTPVTGYEYRVFGPCASGADAICDVVRPTRVRGTSVGISGLNREGTYQFEVRALNAVGASDWSQSIRKDVGPQTARGGRVILSPSSLTVREGGEATYRVRLSSNPTMPVWVVMHWDGTGNENLGAELPFQQFKILLPTGYDTSGLPERCGGVVLDWNEAYAWNAGAPIMVSAEEDDANDEEMAGRPKNASLTILNHLNTVPHDCLNLAEADWSPDPVYEGMGPIALTVTERDND